MTGDAQSSSKAEVMGRIRDARAVGSPGPVDVPRHYDRQPLSGPGDVERFAETVDEYRAQVFRIDAAAVAATGPSSVEVVQVVPVQADEYWYETGCKRLPNDLT